LFNAPASDAPANLCCADTRVSNIKQDTRMISMQAELSLAQIAAAPDAELLRQNLNRFTVASERLSLVAANFRNT
jgi:hypothetical protein